MEDQQLIKELKKIQSKHILRNRLNGGIYFKKKKYSKFIPITLGEPDENGHYSI